ncbi:MAG: exodeoxyribonuclease V subunit gamma [Polyangiaceae bacterium]
MLRLVYSNRTEELLAELAARVAAQQRAGGALAPVRIVAENSTVANYLRLGIAREVGVAANLQTTLITGFAADAIAQALQARVADAEAIEAMALTLLLDESFVVHSDLSPVREHLAAGRSSEAADVRRVQLASRLGRLFEEYTYSRCEMLDAWSRGTTLGGRYAEPEQWQRRIWIAMFGDGGLSRPRGLLPLHQAVAALPVAASLAPAVHVFGFAHLAPVFHDLLQRVARVGDLVIYSLSPCEGFWEDFDRRDPAPLRLWGRPGREHVRALNAAAAFDHDDRFVEPEGDSLLAALQRDLLRRVPVGAQATSSPSRMSDESIVILEHASVRREIEAVASEIWRLLERDPTLRFDDVAVLVCDSDAREYLAHLPSVFREAHDIPLQLVDVGAGSEGGVTEAVELLLALPLGRFTRQELLRLAVHPAVVASLDGVDPSRWLKWCDSLGIVHGADRTDHEDTYIERDILNWDQGLRRLALGAFMAGDPSGERRPFEMGADSYLPHEVAASDIRDAAAFGLLVRSLVADARFVQAAVLPIRRWAALLSALVDTYVAPTSDAEAERLARCLRRLHAMGETDLGGRAIPYRVACELARERIASLDRGRGSEGVVVSRLTSVQPIPFRVVFACGMGEGRFPSADSEDPLDLRRAQRRPGDVTARDRDNYAFLELVLGARDRLYLSYVSRDPLTGDPLEPSSVVQELLHSLGHGYLADSSALRRRHPLRRWDPSYFSELFEQDRESSPKLGTMCLPGARAEARTLALRRSMEAHGPAADRDRVEQLAATDDSWAALARHLGIAPPPAAAPSRESRAVVPMYALVKFLEFPLQGWARFRVGLDEREDVDVLAREDEPFETDRRDETLLLRSILHASVERGSIERAYDEVVRDRELRGSGPSGVFAQGERVGHLHTLETWRKELAAQQVTLDSIEVHRFGRGGEHSAADHVHPPLVIELDMPDSAGVTHIVRAEISGRSLPMGGEAAGASITLSHRGVNEKQTEWAKADRQRAMLRAFVDHAVLSASGVRDGQSHESLVVVATPEEAITDRVRFDPLSRGEATVWLRNLVRELLGAPHAYFFPAEAVLAWHDKDPRGALVARLEAARDLMGDGEGPMALRSAYGPVPRPQAYPLPDEAAARAMSTRRFGLLFEKRREAR